MESSPILPAEAPSRIVGDAHDQTDVEAQVAESAELRAIAADPEAAILAAATEISVQAAALDTAITSVDGLRARYAASNVQEVAAIPAQALDALVAAQADLVRARDAATPEAAAVHVREANASIARCRKLIGTISQQAELLATSTQRVTRLREDARAAIDAAERQLAASAPSGSGTDPAAHERTLAAERLTSARMSLAAADAAMATSPDDIAAVTRHLVAAITSAGAAANALSSVASSRAQAERDVVSAADHATASIAQGEEWLEQGRAPTADEPRIRAVLASARTLLHEAGHLAPTDPVHAATMAWTAHRSATQAASALDPDRVKAPPSHVGHSPEREVLEEVGATLAAMARIAVMGGSLATDIPVRDDTRRDDPDGDGP